MVSHRADLSATAEHSCFIIKIHSVVWNPTVKNKKLKSSLEGYWPGPSLVRESCKNTELKR